MKPVDAPSAVGPPLFSEANIAWLLRVIVMRETSGGGDHKSNDNVQAGRLLLRVHQTEHLSAGFMAEPTGHE
jgi:hypothetical protein